VKAARECYNKVKSWKNIMEAVFAGFHASLEEGI